MPVNATLVQATRYTLAGLANGTTYYFTVAAVNKANRQGGASGEASATPVSATAPATSASPATSATPASPAGNGAAGAPGSPTGASGQVSAEPTGTAVLTATSKKVPKPVIVSLAALALGATAGALTLTARRLRKRKRPRPPAAPPSDVRAVPDKGQPGPVSIHEIGVEETYTVRLEPLPAAIITTIEMIEEISV